MAITSALLPFGSYNRDTPGDTGGGSVSRRPLVKKIAMTALATLAAAGLGLAAPAQASEQGYSAALPDYYGVGYSAQVGQG